VSSYSLIIEFMMPIFFMSSVGKTVPFFLVSNPVEALKPPLDLVPYNSSLNVDANVSLNFLLLIAFAYVAVSFVFLLS
jgi:hypothetical protein